MYLGKKAIKNQKKRLEHGFTLIELLVVMAIVAMLAVMVAPNVFRQQAGAMRDVAMSQISAFEVALDTYRLDLGRYPSDLEDLISDNGRDPSWNGPYLRRGLPLDPWNNNYVYEGDGRSFTLISFGADGQQGGEGDDSDISL
ncbi:type II secretion system major pseudopilin GspG [Gammaproteobacteria bacterium]|nr:type II secretion system major pseudopilin GspG [Gammaproteobacteria bacterium]